MRIVAQRVSRASVSVDQSVIGSIDGGLVLLIGIHQNDTTAGMEFWAEKCAQLRIFEDQGGKMNLSLLETDGSILAISQFTLYADTSKGRRPNFMSAAKPEIAEPLYEHFVNHLLKFGVNVQTGKFGAMMEVEIHNSGPVTIILDSNE